MGYDMQRRNLEVGTILAGSTFESDVYDFSKSSNFSLIFESVSGVDVSYNVSYKISEDAVNFVAPISGEILVDKGTLEVAYPLRVIVAPFVKFYITNNSGNDVTMTVKLIQQEMW